MIDILYFGNCSIDKITTMDSKIECFGGSALNSSLISSLSNLNIAVVSSIGQDFDRSIFGNVTFLGENSTADSNCFQIDENIGSCLLQNSHYLSLKSIPKLETKHLHISFRAGVDIEEILSSEIKYSSLSIDVMIHSLSKYVALIEKYKSKIDLIFCNAKEYEMLKDISFDKSKIIVTNEDKPVVCLEKNNTIAYSIPPITFQILSSTGAGDSFIGGFLGEWVITKSIFGGIINGVAGSNLCLRNYGNYKIKKDDLENERNRIACSILKYYIPKNIIIIGNSCAGKSTLASYLKELYPIYEDIDDYAPLKEIFQLDDLIRNEFSLKTLKNVRNDLKYVQPLCDEYISCYPNISFYSSKPIGEGHNIDRPILWDLILKYAVQDIKPSNNIIQFSRGKDTLYEKKYGFDVYQRSIATIFNNSLLNKSESVIINMLSNLDLRKRRNVERFNNGGHFVAEETMDSVYKEDIPYLEIEGIPVFNVYNTEQFDNEFEKESFFRYNINYIISNYNKGGNNYGFDEVAKRGFSK